MTVSVTADLLALLQGHMTDIDRKYQYFQPTTLMSPFKIPPPRLTTDLLGNSHIQRIHKWLS